MYMQFLRKLNSISNLTVVEHKVLTELLFNSIRTGEIDSCGNSGMCTVAVPPDVQFENATKSILITLKLLYII